MMFRRPSFLLSIVLAVTFTSMTACTHTDQAPTEESLDPAGELSATPSDENVDFDAAQAKANEANDPSAADPEKITDTGDPGDPSQAAIDENAAPDFIDPSEVGLSPKIEDRVDAKGQKGKGADKSDSEYPADSSMLDSTGGTAFAQETPSTITQTDNLILNVTFAKNSSKVKKKFRLPLKEVAKRLKADPQLRVNVAGHTDSRGSSRYNKKLALKRAKAVKARLVKLGVKRKQIHMESYGKDHLLATGRKASDHAQNRRVELTLE